MQPIVPTVSRTGDPKIDRNLDAIATAIRRLSMGGGLSIVSQRFHWPFYIVTSAGGVFTAGPSNSVYLKGSEDLLGIDLESSSQDPWQDGDPLLIRFATTRNLIAGASLSSVYGVFDFGSFGGLSSAKSQGLHVTADSVAFFQLSKGVWALAAAPRME